jgi:hypothetical protein
MQKGDATRALSLHSRGLVVESGHKYDREPAAGCCQAVPQLDSGHAAKMDVDEQAIDICRGIEVEERLGGSKDSSGKSVCVQQTLDAFEHARVVIHYSNYRWSCRHTFPAPCADHGVVDRQQDNQPPSHDSSIARFKPRDHLYLSTIGFLRTPFGLLLSHPWAETFPVTGK